VRIEKTDEIIPKDFCNETWANIRNKTNKMNYYTIARDRAKRIKNDPRFTKNVAFNFRSQLKG